MGYEWYLATDNRDLKNKGVNKLEVNYSLMIVMVIIADAYTVPTLWQVPF